MISTHPGSVDGAETPSSTPAGENTAIDAGAVGGSVDVEQVCRLIEPRFVSSNVEVTLSPSPRSTVSWPYPSSSTGTATGASVRAVTVIVTSAVAAPPEDSAETVIGYEPASVGTPEIRPVDGLKSSPSGRSPSHVQVASKLSGNVASSASNPRPTVAAPTFDVSIAIVDGGTVVAGLDVGGVVDPGVVAEVVVVVVDVVTVVGSFTVNVMSITLGVASQSCTCVPLARNRSTIGVPSTSGADVFTVPVTDLPDDRLNTVTGPISASPNRFRSTTTRRSSPDPVISTSPASDATRPSADPTASPGEGTFPAADHT